MKTIWILGLLFSLGVTLRAEKPSGEVIEVHACEVYTGGCTASAQATMGGRSLLRVWNIASGEMDGVNLGGLRVALVETAERNLAATGTQSQAAVAYLPADLGETQRAAVTRWLQWQRGDEATGQFVVKSAPIEYSREGGRVSIRVGETISLRTRAIAACDAGGCGESLWYEPRTQTSDFTVLVNEHSSVIEPALRLVWKDHNAKSVFFARFGDDKLERKFQLAAVE
jgi:hypothetical protein